ncbi:hypothetical protein Tco_0785337 [Tanacetum coccineum]
MHQFWNTINKVQDSSSYRFKLDNKWFRVDAEVFHDILHICPKLTDQPFDIPPSTDKEIVSFIYELGYTGNIETLAELVVGHMHQPWRTFATNVDFVELLWEDFAFQIDNHFSKGCMPYPRFTKSIINHFISQNKSISMRNRINLHTTRDESLLGTLKYVSKTRERQVYGALIPKEMINEDILNSTAYQTYFAYASDAKEPKKARKFKKHASPKLKTIPVSPKEPTKKPVKKPEAAKKVVPAMKSSRKSQVGVIIKDTPSVSVSKKKSPTKGKRSKGVPDEQQRKISGIDEGNSTKPGVPDVPKYDFESEKESWGDSREEDDDEDNSGEESDDDKDNDDDNDDNNDDDDEAE